MCKGGRMIWGFFQFLGYMGSVVVTFMKDLIWEEITLKDIRTNYLFGKANAYDRANFLRRAVKVYEEILRYDPNNVAVFLNLGGLYYRRGMMEKAIVFYERVIALKQKYAADYIVVSQDKFLDFDEEYDDKYFRIYKI